MGKMFQNASSLKPLGQLKPHCPGMIIGRFSVLLAIGNPRWLPPQVIVLTDAQFRFNRCNGFREEYISVFSPYGPVLIL
jgi:hypothetical protein